MQTVILKPLIHRNAKIIGIEFKLENSLYQAVKKIKDCKWSKSLHCWYVPMEKQYYTAIKVALQPISNIDTVAINEWLHKQTETGENNTAAAAYTRFLSTEGQRLLLSTQNTIALNNFLTHLTLKAYSASTIKTYKNEFTQLLKLLGQKAVDTLTPDDLKRYMKHALETEKISENTAHSRLNALKYYFEQVLGRERFFYEIPRPKKRLLLPKLLNEKEIGKLFNALQNRKHKAMLFTAYSAGLRVSEIVNLKIKDIDSTRMQIFVEKAKGKKDRYVNLSPVLLDILRKYIQQTKPKPTVFLFESEATGTAYPIRTVQQVFSNAKHKAGIQKDVGIHSLRHSFATHLLDKGTDIRYIKDLLGHFDIRTTERYLHVSKQQLINIISPLDDLFEKQSIDW